MNSKNVSDLYKILAKKYNKSPELIKEVVSFPDRYISNHIRTRQGDPILLHNWGTFRISLYGVNKAIRKVLSLYRNNITSREKCIEDITILWALRQKAMKE